MTESPSAPEPKDPGSREDRFRYIGFDVFPKEIPRFWQSDKEAEEFRSQIVHGVGVSSIDRDFSLLHDEPMTRIDRVILTVAGALLVAGAIMPWVSYRTTAGTNFSMSWVGALGTLFGGLGTAFAGGLAVGLSALLSLVLVIGSPVLGAWILASVWRSAPSPEAHQMRLRLPLKLGYVLSFAGLAIGILALIGGRIPGFENWGLIDPGESYNLGTLAAMASYGPYIAMGMSLVAGVKSGDL